MTPELIILAAGVLLGLAYWLRTKAQRREIQRRAQHGHIMEERASDMLKAWGFRVLERNPRIQYTWWLDGEPVETTVEADYLVSSDGKKWLVEVKTGNAARPNRRETRRQLLEYSTYGHVDGIYLLDADRETLQFVQFPNGNPSRSNSPAWIWACFFVLGVIVGLFSPFWH